VLEQHKYRLYRSSILEIAISLKQQIFRDAQAHVLAAEHGDPLPVDALAHNEASIILKSNGVIIILPSPKHKRHALHLAALLGCESMVSILLEGAADNHAVQDSSDEIFPPLHLAFIKRESVEGLTIDNGTHQSNFLCKKGILRLSCQCCGDIDIPTVEHGWMRLASKRDFDPAVRLTGLRNPYMRK
jgi:hypothetical protein